MIENKNILSIFLLISFFLTAMIRNPAPVAAQGTANNGVKEKMILSLLSDKGLSLKEVETLTDSLMTLSPENVEYMLQYAAAAMHLGEFEKAEKVLNRADSLSAASNPYFQVHIKLQKVRLNRMQGKIVNAVVDASDLLNMKKPDSLKYLDIETSLFLADGYLNLGSLKLSKTYLQQAKEMIDRASDISTAQKEDFINNSLASEAQIELYAGNKEKALNLVIEALRHPASHEHNVFLKLLMGAIYEELGEYSRSMKIYKELLDADNPNWWNAMALPRYVNMLMATGSNERIDSVILHYDNFSKIISHTHRGITMDYIRALNSKKNNRDEEAWQKLLEAYSRLDQFAFYHAHGSRQADVIYDIMAVKQAEYKEKLRRSQTLLWIGVALLFLTVVNFFFMLRKIKQKKRRIETLKSALDKKASDCETKERNWDARLKSRASELISVTMMLGRLNELLDAIRGAINSAQTADLKIKEVSKLLSQSQFSDNSDKMLKVQFSQTHGNLLERLLEAHPNITNGEQKMAIYILLGYNTKEIAEITFRSVRSVETMKYRMAKKILANTDQSLEDYLKSYIHNSDSM